MLKSRRGQMQILGGGNLILKVGKDNSKINPGGGGLKHPLLPPGIKPEQIRIGGSC